MSFGDSFGGIGEEEEVAFGHGSEILMALMALKKGEKNRTFLMHRN